MLVPPFNINPLVGAQWTEATIKVVGVDPGTNTVGFSVFEWSPVSRRIVKSMAFTMQGAKMIGDDAFIETHGERVRRVAIIRDNVYRLFHTFNPHYVAVEKPFFNAMRPGAFEPLLQSLAAVTDALWMYDPSMAIMPVDPPSAKKAVGAHGAAKKDDMLKAVTALSETLNFDTFLSARTLEQLDEHSIDALAIGYWGLRQVAGF